MSLDRLQRYHPLVDDVEAFLGACRRPLPVCIWVNPERFPEASGSEERLRVLAQDGIRAAPLRGHPDGFQLLNPDFGFGESLLYRAGAIHVQESASMLPVALLDPRPGERILDLCAAPGNKTAQLAIAVGPEGSVVANDAATGRLGVMRMTLERFGLSNVVIHGEDGRSDAFSDAGFDAVLVDAPCSCEGTLRKHPRVLRKASDHRALAALQRALLSRAMTACRPGGRVVYATCTFAPEENEAVVAAALAQASGDWHLEPVDAARFDGDPGITMWEGASFGARMAGAVRLWPHHADGSGFFAAVLRRPGSATRVVPAPREADSEANSEAQAHARHILDHFGATPPHNIRFAYDGKFVRMVRAQAVGIIGLDEHAAGLAFAKRHSRGPVPTTAGALALADWASRQRVRISPDHVRAYMNQRDVPAEPLGDVQNGPVLVESRGLVLGKGEWADNRLESRYPRVWAGLESPALD